MILSVNNLILSGLYLLCTANFILSIGHCTYVGRVSFSFKIETHTNTLLSVKLSKTQLGTNLYEKTFECISNLWSYHFFLIVLHSISLKQVRLLMWLIFDKKLIKPNFYWKETFYLKSSLSFFDKDTLKENVLYFS